MIINTYKYCAVVRHPFFCQLEPIKQHRKPGGALVSITVNKLVSSRVVRRININHPYSLPKLRQYRIQRLVVFALDEPSVQGFVQVFKEAEDLQFQVLEIACIQGQKAVAWNGESVPSGLLPQGPGGEGPVHHTQVLPLLYLFGKARMLRDALQKFWRLFIDAV